MPWKPKTFGASERHKRERRRAFDKQRAANQPWRKWYFGKRWIESRRLFLGKNPLCVECLKLGKTEPATVVDHVIPHRGDYDRFWDVNNWAALCKQHHDRKTGSGQ